ncbi:hypothetical protein L902_25490 [Agrobacterium radiobacter DSM 30147]|nr:hypothetical protein L902_25490 [Agrobacterium radiobacter DSM 30147]
MPQQQKELIYPLFVLIMNATEGHMISLHRSIRPEGENKWSA